MAANLVAPLAVFSEYDGVLEITGVLGDDACAHRLTALGFCAGKQVTVIQRGDPAILSVGGSRFALASELQERIYVCPVGPCARAHPGAAS